MMDEKLQKNCGLIAENYDKLINKMIWETSPGDVAVMASFILASKGQEADPEKYAACKKILKANASVFSEFRGIGRPMVIVKMSMAEDPEAYLKGAMAVYQKLREIHKFTASPFLLMAALTIYENGGLEQADANIEKLETLYKAEKAAHPFLITDTDRGYLAMVVTGCKNPETVSPEIEKCYEAGKKVALSKDAVHSMAQVLSLSDRPAEQKVQTVQSLLDGLKSAKHPVHHSGGLSALAALALLDMSEGQLVEEISEASDYLKHCRGFKWYQCDRKTRNMYASLAVFLTHAGEENRVLAENISSTLAMVLVEELIMLIVIISVQATRTAASSSGSN